MAIDPGLFLSQVTLFLSLALPLPTLRAHASYHNSAEMWGYLYLHTLFSSKAHNFVVKPYLFSNQVGSWVLYLPFFSFLYLLFFPFPSACPWHRQRRQKTKGQRGKSNSSGPQEGSGLKLGVPKQRLACLPHPHGYCLKA